MIHQPRHFHRVPAIARHLEVAKQGCVGYGALSEPCADAFHRIFHAFPLLALNGIVENGQLLRGFLRHQVNCPDADGPYLPAPLIPFFEHPEAGGGDLVGQLRPYRQLALILAAIEVIAPDIHLDALGAEFVDAESVTHVLGEFQHDPEYLFVIIEVCRAGDAVTDRFYRGYEILLHDPRLVVAAGVGPQGETVHAEQPFEEQRVSVSHVAYGVDAAGGERLRGGGSAVDHLGTMQRPHLFFEASPGDLRDSVGLLHVAAQLGEYLIKGNTYADGQAEFLPDALSDLLGYLHRGALCPAPGDVEPALVHTKGFHLVGEAFVDGAGQLAVLEVLIVLGRYHDQIPAQLPGFPVDHPGLHAGLLGEVGFGEDDAVPVFGGTADGDRFAFQTGVKHHLNGCVKGIKVAVQDRSFAAHIGSPPEFIRTFANFFSKPY